jgi:small subunit ribosomal protein S15Ae
MYTRSAPEWGYVVLTAPNGVLEHEEAIKQKNVVSQVLGYFYDNKKHLSLGNSMQI